MDMPYDANGEAVQTLFPTSPTNASTSGTSARVAIPDDSDVVRVASTEAVYLKFGDSAVVATSSDILFPAGVEVFKVPETYTHVAFIQVSSAGTISICKMR